MPHSKSDGQPANPLDKLPPIERKYGMDAGFEANQHDVEHLCKVWAEVGRAVLMRRGATS